LTAYSVIGDLYDDSGLVGIVTGMFLVSTRFRLAWE
jgi:hypothetical protein